jgi:hypothetical protein
MIYGTCGHKLKDFEFKVKQIKGIDKSHTEQCFETERDKRRDKQQRKLPCPRKQ